MRSPPFPTTEAAPDSPVPWNCKAHLPLPRKAHLPLPRALPCLVRSDAWSDQKRHDEGADAGRRSGAGTARPVAGPGLK
jgi:hypothetical protein